MLYELCCMLLFYDRSTSPSLKKKDAYLNQCKMLALSKICLYLIHVPPRNNKKLSLQILLLTTPLVRLLPAQPYRYGW